MFPRPNPRDRRTGAGILANSSTNFHRSTWEILAAKPWRNMPMFPRQNLRSQDQRGNFGKFLYGQKLNR